VALVDHRELEIARHAAGVAEADQQVLDAGLDCQILRAVRRDEDARYSPPLSSPKPNFSTTSGGVESLERSSTALRKPKPTMRSLGPPMKA